MSPILQIDMLHYQSESYYSTAFIIDEARPKFMANRNEIDDLVNCPRWKLSQRVDSYYNQ